MIYALHLSLSLMMLCMSLPDAPNWVRFLLTLSMLILYTVAILLWEIRCKKVNELEKEIEKLKEGHNDHNV